MADPQTESRKGKNPIKWFFSAPFSGAKDKPEISDTVTTTSGVTSPGPSQNPQAEVAAKPAMAKFLDQSVSNTDLGKSEPSKNIVKSDSSKDKQGVRDQPKLAQATGISEPRSDRSEAGTSTGASRMADLSPSKNPTPPRSPATSQSLVPLQEGLDIFNNAPAQTQRTEVQPNAPNSPRRHVFERPNESNIPKPASTSRPDASKSVQGVAPTSSSQQGLTGQKAQQLTDRPNISQGSNLETRNVPQPQAQASAPQNNRSETDLGDRDQNLRNSARRGGDVLDSVQELPTNSDTEGILPQSTKLEKSYNAALVKCMEFIEADKGSATIAARSGVTGGSVQYFYQIEELRTKREVIETYVEHQHYLIEHIIRVSLWALHHSLPSFSVFNK